jgi:4,5-dihydroxyphthalate decarboxylase
MPDSGVKLDIAIAAYGHTVAVKNGRVPIEGVDANFIEVVPIVGAFRRMVRDVEFDVCEMAPTTHMIARARGAPYIALPIFAMRPSHHAGFVARPDAGIEQQSPTILNSASFQYCDRLRVLAGFDAV